MSSLTEMVILRHSRPILGVLADPPNAHSKLQKPPHAPGGRAARQPPRLTKIRTERSAAAVTPCSSEPPEAAPPPGQRTGGFCQLVRGVRLRFTPCAPTTARLLPSSRNKANMPIPTSIATIVLARGLNSEVGDSAETRRHKQRRI